MTAQPRDQELVQALLAGDEAAFTALIRQHHNSLVRLARMFVSTQASAEEVVQETWEAVLGGLPKFQGRSTLKTWIFRILTNRAKTRGVRDGRTIPMSSLGDDDDRGEPAMDLSSFKPNGHWASPLQRWEADTPEDVLMRGEARAHLKDAISQLPPSQGTVITLRDIEGWTSAEVCNVLEISETNQRVLLHRARSKVRQLLAKYLAEE